jgi:hypothetical protein
MRFRAVSGVIGAAALVVAGLHVPSVRAAHRTPISGRTPIVVELFTSEGCSSCPPADTLLQHLVDVQPVAGAEIIALGEHVDYWDQQGWKDRFSSAALTERQRTYSQALDADTIYTPQMTVDGAAGFVGSDASAAQRAIARAAEEPHGRVSVAFEPSRGERRFAISVTASDLPVLNRGGRRDLFVAFTEDLLTSDVRRGENHGRTLAHAAVVRRLSSIGEASGQPVRADVSIDPSWRREHVRIVAFVQDSHSRRILAAAAVPLQDAGR